MDLIIRNAKMRLQEKVQDIGIENGKITCIAQSISSKADFEVNADGNLVIPPFVDPHLHLDAALLAGKPRHNVSGTLIEGIELWAQLKPYLAYEEIKKRAVKAIKWEVAQGIMYIRTHVDICDPSLLALRVLLDIKEELKEIVHIEIVAFPQDGIVRHPQGKELLSEALNLGADIVGGIPHHEWTREDGLQSIDIAFELANQFCKGIDMHIDETDDDHSRFIEYLAAKTIKEGIQGRVTASHTTAMHSYNNAYAFKLLGLLKEAKINIIANPLDNIALQGRFDSYPKRRGLTRVKEIMEEGINIGIGHDSILDPWYPLGKGSMLQAAFMCLNVAHMTGYFEMMRIFDAITVNSARILQLESYGIEIGKEANLVVLNAESEIDALRLDSEVLFVIKNGRVISKTTPAITTLLGEEINFKFS